MSQDTIIAREQVGTATLVRLANGLRVIVQEDRRSPVAICNVWVRVGSNQEPDHVRGWAHGIEHMLFKGTRRRGERDFALEVAGLGGATNAGTGYETTNYHITLPAENVAGAVDILADALLDSTFEPAALDAERPVLVHENHMYDDLPSGFGVSWRWAMELAFDSSPYRHPIGGRDEVLTSTSRDEIVDFYRAAYRPDNMTVVIAGDVETGAALDLIVAGFGGEAAPPPYALPSPPAEPAHAAPRCRVETGDIAMVYGKMVFPGLSETDPDRATLAVVQQILSDGRSSRLYRHVQEERQLVNGITLLSEAGRREGVLAVDFETDLARAPAAMVAAAGVLQALKDEPPSDEELARAKIRTERSYRFTRETVQGTASLLGWHDAMDDLAGAFTFPEQVAAVDGDDVRRVCRRLFARDGCNVLLYVPREGERDGLPATAEDVDALLAPHLDSERSAGAEAPAPRAPAPARHAGTAPDDRPFEEIVLDGGLRLFVREDRAHPLLTLGLHTAGGVCLQAPLQAGLAHLCQQVQVKGAGGERSADLHSRIEGLGASLSPFTARDHTGVYLTGLTRHLEELVSLVGRIACAPDFPDDELDRERRLALADLQAMDDDPFQAAARQLRAAFYPDHPYGAPVLGDEASLAVLGRDDLRDFHRRTWVPRNMHLVVSGDVEAARLADLLGTALADLPDAPAPERPDLSLAAASTACERSRTARDVKQSVVLNAWRGPVGPNEDRAALALLQQLLNGQSGRLFESLRNRRSLCYATGIQSARGFAPGMLVSYVLTDPATEDEAGAALVEELRRVAADAAPAAEFERARSQLVGNLLIARQSNSARASRCAADVLYGRPPNGMPEFLAEIRTLTPADVRETAARYLGREEVLSVALGPAR